MIIKPLKYLGFLKVDAVSVKARHRVSSVHALIWYFNILKDIEMHYPYFRDFGAVLVWLCVVHQMISGVLMIALPISGLFLSIRNII